MCLKKNNDGIDAFNLAMKTGNLEMAKKIKKVVQQVVKTQQLVISKIVNQPAFMMNTQKRQRN